MRMKPGNEIVCCTADGFSALCEIAELHEDAVVCSVREWQDADNELPVKVTIASGLPKGDKLEWIFQKALSLVLLRLSLLMLPVPLLNLMQKSRQESGPLEKNRERSFRAIVQKCDSRCF